MYPLAVIGAGYWGTNLARSFELTGRAQIRYLCDIDSKKLATIANRYPHALQTTNPQQAICEPTVIGVAIATPVSTHYQLVKEAILAGKHVFVEKPMTSDSRQAKELVALARENGKVFMVGHVFAYNSSVRAIKTMIELGELGTIEYLYFERTNLGPVRDDVNVLWDLAPHDVSIMSYLLSSYPVDVSARGQAFLQNGREDVAFATFSFASGTIANVHVSWITPHKVRRFFVVGRKKMAICDDLNLKAPIRVYEREIEDKIDFADTFMAHKTAAVDGQIHFPRVVINQPLEEECHHFLECIETGTLPLTDGDNGLSVVLSIEAAMRSIHENSAIIPIEVANASKP